MYYDTMSEDQKMMHTAKDFYFAWLQIFNVILERKRHQCGKQHSWVPCVEGSRITVQYIYDVLSTGKHSVLLQIMQTELLIYVIAHSRFICSQNDKKYYDLPSRYRACDTTPKSSVKGIMQNSMCFDMETKEAEKNGDSQHANKHKSYDDKPTSTAAQDTPMQVQDIESLIIDGSIHSIVTWLRVDTWLAVTHIVINYNQYIPLCSSNSCCRFSCLYIKTMWRTAVACSSTQRSNSKILSFMHR